METMHNSFNKPLFIKLENYNENSYINIGYINYIKEITRSDETDPEKVYISYLGSSFKYEQRYKDIKQQIKSKLKFFPNKNFIEIPVYYGSLHFLNNKQYHLFIDKNIIYKCHVNKSDMLQKVENGKLVPVYFYTIDIYYFGVYESISFYQSESFIENILFNVS